MNNEFYVCVPNKYYKNTEITNEEVVVLSLIMKNYNKSKNISLISINMIKEFMCVNNRNARLINNIKKGIEGLIKKNIIVNTYDIHYNNIDFNEIKNNTLFYCEFEEEYKNENYFIVYEKDLEKVFNYLTTSNIDKFAFTRYFISTQRVINCSEKFGYMPHSVVSNIVSKSSTASSYNQILQDELHLIRYENDYVTKEKKYNSTFIGRYDDKEKFIKNVNKKVKEYGLIKVDKKESNKKRSNTQKKNNIKNKIDEQKVDKELPINKEAKDMLDKNMIKNKLVSTMFKDEGNIGRHQYWELTEFNLGLKGNNSDKPLINYSDYKNIIVHYSEEHEDNGYIDYDKLVEDVKNGIKLPKEYKMY